MGPLQGKAHEILSSAIRGGFPSKKTSHGSGGPQGGQLNSTPQPGLEPGIPKELLVPGSTRSLKDGSLPPPPGEPGEMTLERAAPDGISKEVRRAKHPHFSGSYYVPGIFSYMILSLFFRFRDLCSEVNELGSNAVSGYTCLSARCLV